MARQRVQKKAAWGLPSSVRPVVCVPAQASSGQAAGEDVMWREGPVTWHTAPAWSQMGPLGALPELQSIPKVAWSGGVRETPPGEGGQEALSLCRPGPSSSLVRRQGLV